MPNPPLSDDLLRETWDTVKRLGSIFEATKELSVNESSVRHRLHIARDRLGLFSPLSSNKPYTTTIIPGRERELTELLTYKRTSADRVLAHEDAIKLVKIKVKTPGPLGFMIFGDPHIDNEGCDFRLLESHLEIAKARPETILAGNIGDIRDNWIGRLAMLAWKNTLAAKETWKLADWLMHYINWTWLVRGNHDCWSGDNDPLDWISQSADIGVDERHGVRLEFEHPNGNKTRMHVRHDFPGRSIYNANHGLGREARFGFRDHIIAAGHLHYGMDSAEIIADQLIQMVRVCGYKRGDEYRSMKGFYQSLIHPAALIIVDPDQPDGSRSRCFCAPSVEEGAKYLDWKRAHWESSVLAKTKILTKKR
jgi:hypothetical protein